MGDERWYFTREQLEKSPSRKCEVDSARELSYRQQAANFIQDMGQRLQLSQLCINTAIMYMQRFYVFNSFTEVHRNKLSIASLFLAAKVEEQPRKLEHVIKMAHACLHKESPQLDVRSEEYTNKLNEAVAYENILLQTLGFDIGIEHPHTYVVKVCQLVKASKDLAQTSYIMATTSLHMTTMCLQYRPTIVACVCIHLACKWSSYKIEKCSEGKDWFYYVDRNVTGEMLEELTQEFIAILERSPHRFKRKFVKDATMHGPKIMENNPALPGPSGSSSGASTSNGNRPTAVPVENKLGIAVKKERDPSPGPSSAETFNNIVKEKKPVVIKKEPERSREEEKPQKPVVPPPPQPATSSHHQQSSNSTMQKPAEHLLGPPVSLIKSEPCESVEPPQVKLQIPTLPIPQPQAQPPPPTVQVTNEHSSSRRSSKEPSESSSSSRKHKSKHVSKSKSSSSSNSNNHSEPTSSGIKVKIRKDIISLSGVDCNQKYATPVKESSSPKKTLKIKLPKPPPPPPVETPKMEMPPTSLKIVLTKDKSGSGSYSTSHKSEHRESRKRSHNTVPDGSHRDHKNSVDPSNKHPKVDSYQKHHSSNQRPNKVSRHSSSHRADVDNSHNSTQRLQYPSMSDNSTFQNYTAVPNYQNPYLIPPPPLPKLKGHNMMAGRTNSNFPMQPPLPPDQPPPPPPPPEDI